MPLIRTNISIFWNFYYWSTYLALFYILSFIWLFSCSPLLVVYKWWWLKKIVIVLQKIKAFFFLQSISLYWKWESLIVGRVKWKPQLWVWEWGLAVMMDWHVLHMGKAFKKSTACGDMGSDIRVAFFVDGFRNFCLIDNQQLK